MHAAAEKKKFYAGINHQEGIVGGRGYMCVRRRVRVESPVGKRFAKSGVEFAKLLTVSLVRGVVDG
jgi:hypothetical protein